MSVLIQFQRKAMTKNVHTIEFKMYLWRRQWHPTSVLLTGKSCGWRSLVGCSPWGHQESDTTEQLQFHFSLACIGKGNGNPLQCSCLENPRDGGAWWAAVYGVTQSQTRLKRLSSSSSSPFYYFHWFKKINSSLISITEKDQVNTERYIGRSKTMPVANGNYTFD